MSARPTFDAPAPVGLPVPLSYHVVVRPKRVKTTSAGGIAFASRTQAAERAVRTIGELVAIGPLAWKAKTQDLDFAQDEVAQGLKPGDWVIYRLHAGQKLRARDQDDFAEGADDDYYVLLADTDVLAKLTPEQATQFYDWV